MKSTWFTLDFIRGVSLPLVCASNETETKGMNSQSCREAAFGVGPGYSFLVQTTRPLRVRVQCLRYVLGLLGTGGPRTAISTFTHFLSCMAWVQCCFTSTETIIINTETILRTIIRDGEPRTATSTFTQLLSCMALSSMLLTSPETIRTVRDREPRDGHLDFHTDSELWAAPCVIVGRTL